MVKSLHHAMLLPLCLSMLLSAVPVHASEAGRGSAAVEAAVIEGETVAEEGGDAAATEETAEASTEAAAVATDNAAEETAEVADTADTAEVAATAAADTGDIAEVDAVAAADTANLFNE